MGEPVSVIRSSSGGQNAVRFETNRSFTGMGHERYVSGDPITGNRPPDVLASKLLETGQAVEIHIYAQTITVYLDDGANYEGLQEIVEEHYTYYRPGVEVPTPESFQY